MQLGLIEADGSGFKLLQQSEPTHHNYWSVTWARDGRSLYAQDMESLYQLGLDATVMKKWKIEQLIPQGGMSGDSRFSVSPDGKHFCSMSR